LHANSFCCIFLLSFFNCEPSMLKVFSLLIILLCNNSIFATAFTSIKLKSYTANIDGANIAHWMVGATPNAVICKIKELQAQGQSEDIYAIIENIVNINVLENVLQDKNITLDLQAQELILHSSVITPDLLKKVFTNVSRAYKQAKKDDFAALLCEVFEFQSKNPLITEDMVVFIYEQAKSKKYRNQQWIKNILHNEQFIKQGWHQKLETLALNENDKDTKEFLVNFFPQLFDQQIETQISDDPEVLVQHDQVAHSLDQKLGALVLNENNKEIKEFLVNSFPQSLNQQTKAQFLNIPEVFVQHQNQYQYQQYNPLGYLEAKEFFAQQYNQPWSNPKTNKNGK